MVRSDRERRLTEDEWPDGDDLAEGEEPGEARCPSCQADISEDCQKCPNCGEWIVELTSSERRARSWAWPIIVAILIAVILLVWIMRS